MSTSKKIEDWKAVFIGSFVKADALPKKKLPIIAVIGRSNVGKSSLLNTLCKTKNLARVSASPGKTQQLNFFEINEHFYLVDMPGYGYAKVSKTQRGEWSTLASEFLQKDENLVQVMVLVDSNIPTQAIDLKFINWCGENQIPFVIIRTKCDKSKKREIDQIQSEFETTLSESWEELPVIIRHSSVEKTGTEEIKKLILKSIKSV